MKLWDREIDVLRNVSVSRPRRGFVPYPPQPGFSLVFDRVYQELSAAGLIRWVQVDAVYASLSDDHYVLTDGGRAALERAKTEFVPIEVSA